MIGREATLAKGAHEHTWLLLLCIAINVHGLPALFHANLSYHSSHMILLSPVIIKTNWAAAAVTNKLGAMLCLINSACKPGWAACAFTLPLLAFTAGCCALQSNMTADDRQLNDTAVDILSHLMPDQGVEHRQLFSRVSLGIHPCVRPCAYAVVCCFTYSVTYSLPHLVHACSCTQYCCIAVRLGVL